MIATGHICKTQYGPCTVLKYVSSVKIMVEFPETGYKTWTTAVQVRKRSIYDPYAPSMYGVGFVGTIYPTKEHPIEYDLWCEMFRRVHVHVAYRECSINSRWHSFENFVEDIHKMDNWNAKGFELDKDLRVLGNKQYGPKTCSFVPHSINSLLVTGTNRVKKSTLPTGVQRNGKGYLAQIRINSKKESLGTYPTREEAHLVYCEAKVRNIRCQVRQYKDDLHRDVVKTLKSLTVDHFYEM